MKILQTDLRAALNPVTQKVYKTPAPRGVYMLTIEEYQEIEELTEFLRSKDLNYVRVTHTYGKFLSENQDIEIHTVQLLIDEDGSLWLEVFGRIEEQGVIIPSKWFSCIRLGAFDDEED